MEPMPLGSNKSDMIVSDITSSFVAFIIVGIVTTLIISGIVTLFTGKKTSKKSTLIIAGVGFTLAFISVFIING